MVDHSLHGYLKRRTTEELNFLLDYCLQEEQYTNYGHVIIEIRTILEERIVSEVTPE